MLRTIYVVQCLAFVQHTMGRNVVMENMESISCHDGQLQNPKEKEYWINGEKVPESETYWWDRLTMDEKRIVKDDDEGSAVSERRECPNRNCAPYSMCDPAKGADQICVGCKPGRWGTKCQYECGKDAGGNIQIIDGENYVYSKARKSYLALDISKKRHHCHTCPQTPSTEAEPFGACDSCETGYFGRYCPKDDTCYYTCEQKCGHCASGKCDPANGVCEKQDGKQLCKAGYKGKRCKLTDEQYKETQDEFREDIKRRAERERKIKAEKKRLRQEARRKREAEARLKAQAQEVDEDEMKLQPDKTRIIRGMKPPKMKEGAQCCCREKVLMPNEMAPGPSGEMIIKKHGKSEYICREVSQNMPTTTTTTTEYSFWSKKEPEDESQCSAHDEVYGDLCWGGLRYLNKAEDWNNPMDCYYPWDRYAGNQDTTITQHDVNGCKSAVYN